MGWVSEEGVASVTPFIMFMIPEQRLLNHMQYLKHAQECFVRYTTPGEAERCISGKARIASVLNDF